MVNDRIEESKATVEASQVDSAKLLEYVNGNRNTANNSGNEVINNRLLPSLSWSDRNTNSSMTGPQDNLQLAGFWEKKEAAQAPKPEESTSITKKLSDQVIPAAIDTGKLLGAGGSLYILGKGYPRASGLAFAGVAAFSAWDDFNNLTKQNSFNGIAKYTTALAVDSVLAASSVAMAVKGVDGGPLAPSLLAGALLARLDIGLNWKDK
jgi:hypothetical protein